MGEGLNLWPWLSSRKASGCSAELTALPIPAGPVAGQFSVLGVFANLVFKDGGLSFQRIKDRNSLY